MLVVWSEEAAANLEQIGTYVADRNRGAAATLLRRIVEAVDGLTAHPLKGRIGRAPGTRELVIRGTSYIVPYRVSGARCEILAVFHARRQWPETF